MSIRNASCIFKTIGNDAKFDIEPTSPNAGPTLPKHDIDDDTAVIISNPKRAFMSAPTKTTNR